MSEPSSLIGYDRLADRVRQHRQAVDCPVLVVEGPDDRTTLGKIFPGVAIFPAAGRKNALEESQRLLEWSFQRWACVVDRDFDGVVASYNLGSHLHSYQGADLEGMLILLGVLHDLLEHFGSSAKIAHEGGIDHLVKALRDEVAGVANLRTRNAAESWGLPFDRVPLESKIDRRSMQLNIHGYCAALKGRDVPVKLSTLIEAANGRLDDPDHFSGKDVVAATAVALRSRCGSLPKAQADREILLTALRASSAWRLNSSDWVGKLQSVLKG